VLFDKLVSVYKVLNSLKSVKCYNSLARR
jgi:hypothetical protein